MDGYAFHLYCSSEYPRIYSSGEEVFVWLKSDRSTGRAFVLAAPQALPSDSPFAGRYHVKFTACGSTAHVRPERLLPVFDQQKPHVLVCYTTEDYRRLARSQVASSDVVLELGCSFGMCTNMLAEHAGHVVGIDNSEEVVAEARRRYPHIRFKVADALSEPAAMLSIARSSSTTTTTTSSSSSSSSKPSTSSTPAASSHSCPNADDASASSDAKEGSAGNTRTDSGSGACNVVFVDIGGNRQLEALLRLMPWVLQHLKPRLLVVKSEELADAAGRQLLLQQQQQQGLEHQRLEQQQQQQQQQQQVLGQECVGKKQQCTAAQQEEQQQQQEQGASCVQQLHAQLQPAVVLAGSTQKVDAAGTSSLGVMKSSSSSSSSSSQACTEPNSSSSSSVVHHPQQPHTHQPLKPSAVQQAKPGQILNPQAWWDQLEVECGLNPLLHAGRAETWFLQARENGFVKNPLRYPQRFTGDGTRICRPHNYDVCLKIDTCLFDHGHCHHCGVAGHRAVDCPVV